MSKRNVAKGKEWEREAAKYLTRATGVEWKRVLTETREGNRVGDLENEAGLPGTMQCKAGVKIRIWDGWREAKEAALRGGSGVPAVALFRVQGVGRHRAPERVAMLDIEDFAAMYAAWLREQGWETVGHGGT
jgi:hypothetical protein